MMSVDMVIAHYIYTLAHIMAPYSLKAIVSDTANTLQHDIGTLLGLHTAW